MADILNIQSNQQDDLFVLSLPTLGTNYLKYAKGGGSLFPNLVDDLVVGGKQWHQGNPPIEVEYTIKTNDKTLITSSDKVVTSPFITKGLFYFDVFGARGHQYFWDEVYTTPLGLFECLTSGGTLTHDTFYVTNNNSEELYVSISDVNIVPKIGDYLFLQKVDDTFTLTNDSTTDGINNIPVVVNSEVYQFKILNVIINSGIYKLVLDKSIKSQVSKQYILVLLNRENTGIQKELFFDTFETREIQRDQLLGDPYNNTSNTSIPIGRKNYLNYNSAQYLGLNTLLKKVINDTNTPVIVFDLNDEIRDSFSIPTTTSNFEIILPFLLFQDDVRIGSSDIEDPQKIVNLFDQYFEGEGVGKYTGLYFSWDSGALYRVGWLFYDLRIAVIDDPEVATALSYNSNRNYTLPRMRPMTFFGNTSPNPGGGLDLEIENITNGPEVTVKTVLPHNLAEGTLIFISDLYVRNLSGGIIPSSINGYGYVKLLTPNDPFRFKIYDVTLTIPTPGNGTFYANPNGSSGKVKGSLPRYNYFYTYRLIGKHYTSTLPFAQTTDFNFAKDKLVNNVDGELFVGLHKINWLIDSVNLLGFEATDLEVIIGKYENNDVNNPQTITGITDVVSIPISAPITYTRNLFDGFGVQTDFSTSTTGIRITKADYDTFVAKPGPGTYDETTNPNGLATYDIKNNFKHYTYITGSLASDLVTGKGKWSLINVKYQTDINQYRSNIQITIPADKWNDTTNPTYDPSNTFINDRFISEVALVLTDANSGVDIPMIYTKVAPPIKKTNDLDLIVNLKLDW